MSFKDTSINQIKFVSFTGSSSNYGQIQPKLRVRNYNADWIFIVLCFCIALFAFINTVYKRRVLQLIKAFWASEYSSQLVKSENVLVKQSSVLLSTLFLFSFSLFIYQFAHHFYRNIVPYKGLEMYFIIMLYLIIFYTSKLLLYQIVAVVFNAREETKEYIFNMILINQTMGLVLLPLIALLNYLPTHNHALLLFIGLFFITVLFLYRITKGLVAFWFSRLFSKSYLFLYLCALEILPLLLIGKFVLDKYQL